MPRLEENEERHLRTLTLDFDPNEMATLYKDVHKKGFIELVALAWEIKERRNKGKQSGVGTRDGPVPAGSKTYNQHPVAKALQAVVRQTSDVVDRKPDLTPVIDLTSDDDVGTPEVAASLPRKRGRGGVSFAEKRRTGVGLDQRFLNSEARLARIKKWIKGYAWTGDTTRRDILDSFMSLENKRKSDSSTFGTEDALRAFLMSRKEVLSEYSGLFAEHFLADKSGPCCPFRPLPRLDIPPRHLGQARNINDDNSESDSDPEDSDLSNVSDQSEYKQAEPCDLNKKRKRIRQQHYATPPELLKGEELSMQDLHRSRLSAAILVRAQRLFAYSVKYGPNQRTGKVNFYLWVIQQDDQATAKGYISDKSAFGTSIAVVDFISRNAELIRDAPGGGEFLNFLEGLIGKGKPCRPTSNAEAGSSKNP